MQTAARSRRRASVTVCPRYGTKHTVSVRIILHALLSVSWQLTREGVLASIQEAITQGIFPPVIAGAVGAAAGAGTA